MVWLEAFLAGLGVAIVTTPAGVSGAVLLLPVQVSWLGVPSPSVTPTNLLFNLFATPSGVLRYRRTPRPRSQLPARLLAGTVPGVCIGAVIRVEWLSGQRVFYLAAAIVLATMGILLLVSRPRPDVRLGLRVVPAVAFVVGIAGGIYGVGGGSLLAPLLLLGGYSVFEIAPAALLSTMAASVIGLVTYLVLAAVSSGDVSIAPDWTVGVAAGLGGVVGAYIGASLQPHIPEARLRNLLALLALVIAARYLYLAR
jgi:uncharacterized protein